MSDEFTYNGRLLRVCSTSVCPYIVDTTDNSVAVLICKDGSWSSNYNQTTEINNKYYNYLLFTEIVKYILFKYEERQLDLNIDTCEWTKDEIREMVKLCSPLAALGNRTIDTWKQSFKYSLCNLTVAFVKRDEPFFVEYNADNGCENLRKLNSFNWMKLSSEENCITLISNYKFSSNTVQ